jgi:hypothetical protein
MSDQANERNDEDVLGGSEYFTGGCGCGGVEGGGYLLDNGLVSTGAAILSTLGDLTGISHFKKAYEKPNTLDKASYALLGTFQLLLVLLLVVRYVLDEASDSWSVILLAVLVSVSGALWLGVEAYQKFSVVA